MKIAAIFLSSALALAPAIAFAQGAGMGGTSSGTSTESQQRSGSAPQGGTPVPPAAKTMPNTGMSSGRSSTMTMPATPNNVTPNASNPTCDNAAQAKPGDANCEPLGSGSAPN